VQLGSGPAVRKAVSSWCAVLYPVNCSSSNCNCHLLDEVQLQQHCSCEDAFWGSSMQCAAS
jgi:hypothetical protein